MSLRDRIAEAAASRHGAGDIADAILSDPEIAALREVARLANEMAAQAHAKGSVTFDVVREMLAALARLEEARRD